jgi:hypothetical protein
MLSSGTNPVRGYCTHRLPLPWEIGVLTIRKG